MIRFILKLFRALFGGGRAAPPDDFWEGPSDSLPPPLLGERRKAFYDALRPTLGALTEANVDGFERVLDEANRRRTPLHQLAYILATAWWESGKTMQPVREAFWIHPDDPQKAEAWRKRNLARYYPHYGRGLVQTTWPGNYEKLEAELGLPPGTLVNDPDKLLTWEYSLPALFVGMEKGLYTGKSLGDYIDGVDESDAEDFREFKNARRIVNGTDRDDEIGRLALAFEAALKAAVYDLSGEAG